MQTFHFGSRNILELSNAATHDFPDLFQQTFFKKVLIFVMKPDAPLKTILKSWLRKSIP